jgi:hypothetical protein
MELVQSMSDDDDRLIVARRVLQPNGSTDEDDASDQDKPADEDRIAQLQKVFETFASMDFPPREDAWL